MYIVYPKVPVSLLFLNNSFQKETILPIYNTILQKFDVSCHDYVH